MMPTATTGMHRSAAAVFHLTIIFLSYVDGMPCTPKKYRYKQPNGQASGLITCFGGEFGLTEYDERGFPLAKDDKGYVVFLGATNCSYPTNMTCGKKELKEASLNVTRKLTPQPRNEWINNRSSGWKDDQRETGGTKGRILLETGQNKRHLATGTLMNLVVPCRFADHRTRQLPTKIALRNLFNAKKTKSAAPTGSVKAYYWISSYRKLTIHSTVVDWIQLDKNESWYANGYSGKTPRTNTMVEECLRKLQETGFDFANFDANNDYIVDGVTILHSGYGSEHMETSSDGVGYENRIWSHFRSLFEPFRAAGVFVFDYNINTALWGTEGNEITRIGTLAHEMGHNLRLVDLYDTDSVARGIGSWGLMANSWGLDGSQWHPPIISPYHKERLGWISPISVDESGEYTLRNSHDFPDVVKISREFPKPEREYLMIEFRDAVGFESIIPQPGLAIWHIDLDARFDDEGHPGMSNWPQTHYKIALLQRDCKWDLERGNNRGDATDLYVESSFLGPSPSGNCPNTDSYNGGVLTPTNILIDNIRINDGNITFRVEFPSVPSVSPSVSPVPSANPTQSLAPSFSTPPTLMPSAAPTPGPSGAPTSLPSPIAKFAPSTGPTILDRPTYLVTALTIKPSTSPSDENSFSSPSTKTTFHSTYEPVMLPSSSPSFHPKSLPSSLPSTSPSSSTTLKPTIASTLVPSTTQTTIVKLINVTGDNRPPTHTPSILPIHPPTTSPAPVPKVSPADSPTVAISENLLVLLRLNFGDFYSDVRVKVLRIFPDNTKERVWQKKKFKKSGLHKSKLYLEENSVYQFIVSSECANGDCGEHGKAHYSLRWKGETLFSNDEDVETSSKVKFSLPWCSWQRIGQSCEKDSDCCSEHCESNFCVQRGARDKTNQASSGLDEEKYKGNMLS